MNEWMSGVWAADLFWINEWMNEWEGLNTIEMAVPLVYSFISECVNLFINELTTVS